MGETVPTNEYQQDEVQASKFKNTKDKPISISTFKNGRTTYFWGSVEG